MFALIKLDFALIIGVDFKLKMIVIQSVKEAKSERRELVQAADGEVGHDVVAST